ncbi:WbqC family protein [Bordetella pseudohinzii]|uniref:WbmP n=1 Tax=Bordetella pseudohinzii TaxID=1331258 RepID=A0A0J6C5D7_9BORD|nr:WbqC family protein [Bordetella pseudohinzii]ANY18013.1 wbmP [Bordetella pseudohinzii]KMM26328.1 wbmP [Bordetella pseudohinzii]KXA79556.1 wbmP [Bordetella pseudohinzii]KXA80865.1 wbmP [Bordetella pseudohinzii]CUI81124.1 WbqC-like protein family [Bordetella pseudohinzii]
MMTHRICAIHQPNFFPWLGYFDKIARSDVFILLDDVQYSHGSWTNRVQMRISGQPKWVTAPVDRSYHGGRAIRDMRFSPINRGWREKVSRAIAMSYARAPYFREAFPLVEAMLMRQTESLSEFNIGAIVEICALLGIPREKLLISSDLGAVSSATDLLIDLTRRAGADAYMCGGGTSGYQEDEKFRAAGIGLIYQGFRHPVYPQHGQTEFNTGLSIVDALMETGVQGTRSLLAGAGRG